MTRFLRLSFLRHLVVLACGLIGFMLMSTSAVADTPFPTVHLPANESLKCIQPADEMRRNHMNYILHQRDITMHDGIRTEPDSLSGCIDCHVEPRVESSGKEGEIASFKSNEHFCSSCHQYAAVQIDCFQCHADRPQKYIKRSSHTSSLKNQLQQALAATAEVGQ